MIDQIEMWDNNPFVHYNIKMYNNHFKLQKKVARVNCKKCKARACNSYCSFKLCLKCCVEHVLESTDDSNCKIMTHQMAKNNAMIHDVIENVVDGTD